jgi:hypothetical protein
MSTIDASQCWRIMPFSMFDGEDDEWWVLGPDSEPVDGGIVPTKEQAYAIALEHNKKYGVDAVYVYTTSSMRKGNWEKPPEEAQPQVTTDEIWEQMDKDFEHYKEKMAEGAYPEAEDVEEDVRKMKEVNPDAPEENERKLAVSYIAAKKRLKKIFFPVDHNEDPPTPETVAILLKCWHVLPVVRDEDEGETWWVLGPNNKAAQEASTAGPFKTKKEAFWIALEHNRTLGVNAVYVHRKENGELEGDFEEPSDDDFEDEPAEQPSLEQSIMEVGDQAMKNVLADLRKEERAASHAPKRSRKPMNKRKLEEEQRPKWSRVRELITSIKDGAGSVLAFIAGVVVFLIVSGAWVIVPVVIDTVTHRATAPAETDEKNDCAIVATEAYNRLRTQGVWAEVVGMKVDCPDGKSYGHAVCFYQPSANATIWAYDSAGTTELEVRSADLRVLEWAFNQALKPGYKASEFKVLAQEPAKAKPARQLAKR